MKQTKLMTMFMSTVLALGFVSPNALAFAADEAETAVETGVTIGEIAPDESGDDQVASILYTGTCGENVTWTIDSEGVLCISGTGSLNVRPVVGGVPDARCWWYPHRAEITSVYIEEGVRANVDSSNLFSGLSGSIDINLSGLFASGVANVRSMFAGCTSVDYINISSFDMSGVTSTDGMFAGCASLSCVVLPSSGGFAGLLPAPDPAYIPGATGLWENSEGEVFSSSEIPANVADTYMAEIAVVDEPGEDELGEDTPGADDPIVSDSGEEAPGEDGSNSHAFSDVGAGAWYRDAVMFSANMGLIEGYEGTGRFGPTDVLTRAQAAAILWRYFEPEQADSYDASAARNVTGLPDVAGRAWYTGAANWAVGSGVIAGVSGRRFAPDETITREQLCTIVGRAASRYCGVSVDAASAAGLNAVPDSGAVSPWARQSVAWSLEAGVIFGMSEGGTRYVRPGNPVDRATMAAIMMNSIQNDIISR